MKDYLSKESFLTFIENLGLSYHNRAIQCYEQLKIECKTEYDKILESDPEKPEYIFFISIISQKPEGYFNSYFSDELEFSKEDAGDNREVLFDDDPAIHSTFIHFKGHLNSYMKRPVYHGESKLRLRHKEMMWYEFLSILYQNFQIICEALKKSGTVIPFGGDYLIYFICMGFEIEKEASAPFELRSIYEDLETTKKKLRPLEKKARNVGKPGRNERTKIKEKRWHKITEAIHNKFQSSDQNIILITHKILKKIYKDNGYEDLSQDTRKKTDYPNVQTIFFQMYGCELKLVRKI